MQRKFKKKKKWTVIHSLAGEIMERIWSTVYTIK